MTTVTASPVPWQLTGNHWLALPCVHPADGAVHACTTPYRLDDINRIFDSLRNGRIDGRAVLTFD